MIVEVHFGGGKGYSTPEVSYDDAIVFALEAKLDERARTIIAKEGNEVVFTYTRYPRESDGQEAWKFKAVQKGL